MAEDDETAVLEAVAGLTRAGADPAAMLDHVVAIRRVLGRAANPPIDDVIRAGAVPLLTAALEHDAAPLLQYEAAWALTNCASGSREQTDAVIDSGAVNHFVRLLHSSPNADVREQVLWALGNISGDCVELHALVVGLGCVPALVAYLSEAGLKLTALRTASWVMSNLCGSHAPLEHAAAEQCMDSLIQMALGEDGEVRNDALWGLARLSAAGEAADTAARRRMVAARAHSVLVHGMAGTETNARLAAACAVSLVTEDGAENAAWFDTDDFVTACAGMIVHSSQRMRDVTLACITNSARASPSIARRFARSSVPGHLDPLGDAFGGSREQRLRCIVALAAVAAGAPGAMDAHRVVAAISAVLVGGAVVEEKDAGIVRAALLSASAGAAESNRGGGGDRADPDIDSLLALLPEPDADGQPAPFVAAGGDDAGGNNNNDDGGSGGSGGSGGNSGAAPFDFDASSAGSSGDESNNENQ